MPNRCGHGYEDYVRCVTCMTLSYQAKFERPPTDDLSYSQLGQEIASLVEEKQKAYGDSFGKSGQVMRLMYPNGVSAEGLEDALVVVRIIDKLFRVATRKDAFGESPFGDIIGYGLLALRRDRLAKSKKKE